MSDSVVFSPKVTSVQFAGGNVKMTLVAPVDEVNRLVKADISELQGQYITANLMPESIEVVSDIDEEGHPTVVYELDNGVWTPHKQEQTNLLDEEKLIQKSEFISIREVDRFILQANYLEHDWDINPKQLIEDVGKGIKFKDIANENETSVDEVESILADVRKTYAPYALAAKKVEDEANAKTQE